MSQPVVEAKPTPDPDAGALTTHEEEFKNVETVLQ